MNHRRWVALSVACLSLAACEDPPKPEAKPAEAVATAPLPAPSAAPPAPSTKATAKPVKKLLADCPKGPALIFGQKAIEDEVRRKLPKPTGDITIADLKKLKSLNTSQVKLDELDVCLFSHMTGLKELFLGEGSFDDLSPIAGATSLESLRASINQVSDLGPLAKLKKLDRLDLGRTQVKDITPLAELTELTELQLDGTQVEDIAPLAKLTKLETLSLRGTKVKDLSPLKGLKKLKSVDGRDTPADEDPMNFAALRGRGVKIVNQ